MAENGLGVSEDRADAYCAATELATAINSGADVLEVMTAYGKLTETMQVLVSILLEDRSRRRLQ